MLQHAPFPGSVYICINDTVVVLGISFVVDQGADCFYMCHIGPTLQCYWSQASSEQHHKEHQWWNVFWGESLSLLFTNLEVMSTNWACVRKKSSTLHCIFFWDCVFLCISAVFLHSIHVKNFCQGTSYRLELTLVHPFSTHPILVACMTNTNNSKCRCTILQWSHSWVFKRRNFVLCRLILLPTSKKLCLNALLLKILDKQALSFSSM